MDDDQLDLTAQVNSRTPEAVNVDTTYLLSQSSVSAGPTIDNQLHTLQWSWPHNNAEKRWI